MNNIGIISGGGKLPLVIGRELIKKNYRVVFFVIEEFFNTNLYRNLEVKIINLYSAKKIIQSLKSHKIFKCNSLSRVDFILKKKENKIFFLEINSQPGMTKMSLLPEQAKFKKIKFNKMFNL